MTRNPPSRASGPEPQETPVVLPHALITVTQAGALEVTIDGTDFPPPQSDGEPWTRNSFGSLLDALTQDRTITVRIQVHETDGSMFTDIIHARRRTAIEPPQAGVEDRRGKHAKTKHTNGSPKAREPALVEVTADGFVPGEDVAVAVIVSHTDATQSGDVRALVDKRQLTSVRFKDTGEVVMFGRVSGTIHVRRLS